MAHLNVNWLAPVISAKEALVAEIEEFVRCIETSARPLTDGASGLRVVEMLAAASQSTCLRGQPVELRGLEKASWSRFSTSKPSTAR